MIRRSFPLALLCVLGFFVLHAPAADWPHWRGPWQNGVSPEKNLPDKWSPEGENLIWKAHVGCRSTPLVMNGKVFLINYTGDKETTQERVLCLDADTGKTLWQYNFNVFHADIVTVRLGWTNLAGDPVTGNIYAHGSQGLLLCLSKDGKLLWQRSLTEEFGRITGYGGRVTSPTVDGDLVIMGMLNSSWGDQAKGLNRWVAFNKNNGQVAWWSEPFEEQKGTYYSVPVVATINGQRLLITGASEGSVVALKVNTGEKVWSYNFSVAAINSSPVVDGNFVYIGQGEENPGENSQGQVICLDASKVKDGQPELVWKRDNIRARYASPIIDPEAGRLYIPDTVGTLFCLDAKTGDQLWKFRYGRNIRGSPVLADGKIYLGEVFSKFYILKPGPKKCEQLHEQVFTSPDGKSDVEVNGSPAIANGRIYFGHSDEFFCIGFKDAKSAAIQQTEAKVTPKAKGAHLQIYPADVAVGPGDAATFTLRLFDEDGNFIKEIPAKDAAWTLPTPPIPPGKKTGPPALKGEVADGKLAIDAKVPNQAGYVLAKVDGLAARARVRVAPNLPYAQDFSKIPDGAVPGGWVNCAGKFYVTTLKGQKVLTKVNTKSAPPLAQGNTYFGLPTMKDYTIQCDVMGTKQQAKNEKEEKEGEAEQISYMPEIGVVANRYSFYLVGNAQKLRLASWDALPRVDNTISYPWEPGKWYRLKLTVDQAGGKAHVKGKIWPRDDKEPANWTLELFDSSPNTEGAPALYGYVTNPHARDDSPGEEAYFANVVVTSNKK